MRILFNDTMKLVAPKNVVGVWAECKSSDNLDQQVARRKHAPAFVTVWAAVSGTGSSPRK